MITLSNGHSFEYMAASGALAYDGRGWPWEKPLSLVGKLKPELFTSVTKTLTAEPREGNLKWAWPYHCIRHLPGGEVNAVGLSNPGIRWWLRTHGQRVSREELPLVASIYSPLQSELESMITALNAVDLVGIELNMSCPNVDELTYDDPLKLVAAVRRASLVSAHPLIVKVSPTQPLKHIAVLVQDMVQAYAINAVPWSVVFQERVSPLQKLGGGAVSGKAAQPWTWEAVRRLVESGRAPVIGPSVWQYEDIDSLRNLGASAISFGSIFMRRPAKPTAWVERDMAERRV